MVSPLSKGFQHVFGQTVKHLSESTQLIRGFRTFRQPNPASVERIANMQDRIGALHYFRNYSRSEMEELYRNITMNRPLHNLEDKQNPVRQWSQEFFDSRKVKESQNKEAPNHRTKMTKGSSEDDLGISFKELRKYDEKMYEILSALGNKPTPDQVRHIHSFGNSQITSQSSADKNFLHLLSLIPKDETSRILFHSETEKVDLDKIHEDCLQTLDRSRNFKKAINDIINGKGSTYEKTYQLEMFVYTESGGGLKNFNYQELKEIYMRFWDLEAYDHMVEMVEHSTNGSFVMNPVTLDFYARAILKGHHFNVFNANAVANYLLSKNPPYVTEANGILGIVHAISKNAAKQMLAAIDRGFPLNKDVAEMYQKCFPDSFIERGEVLINYKESLLKSAKYFEAAFTVSYDCRYGCRALHRVLELEDAGEIEKYALLTRMAAMKEGGLKSNNIAVVRSYLESLYASSPMNENEIELAEKIVICLCEKEGQVKDLVASLNDLYLPKESAARVEEFKQQLYKHLLEMSLPTKKESKREKLKALREDWENYTYAYKGLNSNYIEGNFKFGAQLPTQNINRYERAFFTDLLDLSLDTMVEDSKGHKKLKDVKSFEEFNEFSDHFIRERFHTDEWELERLDSDGHQVFDKSVQALNALGGGPTKEDRKLMPDSRTNVSNNFILGLGDCRHHSQVKQILYDIWHSSCLNQIIGEVAETLDDESLESDEVEERLGGLQKSYNELLRQEMRVFDLEVYLPIELKDGYPVWKDGYMVKNTEGKAIKVEEHTLNVELQHSEDMKKVDKVTLRDSFYQKTYPWKAQEVVNLESLLKDGVKVGSIQVLNQAGELERVDIQVRPASYAGSKESYDRGNDDAYFIGQQVRKLSFNEAKEMDGQLQDFLSAVRDWHKS